MENFKSEQLSYVKNISMSLVARSLGFTVVNIGTHKSLKEMDSLIIYDDKSWYRWSRQYGGSTIDFVMRFGKMNIVDAVNYLLSLDGSVTMRNEREMRQEGSGESNKAMKLPEPLKDKYRRTFAYLAQTRCLDVKTIRFFIDKKILYEDSEHHNLVFLGLDKNGTVRYATKHGTLPYNGKYYKGDVTGNDKSYGVNIRNTESDEVNVFEAAIDMMSYCELADDYERTNKIALGMLHDQPLETFLMENPQIKKIHLWLDNDDPGRNAAEKLLWKYAGMGFEIDNNTVPEGKDVNEYLQIKKTQNDAMTQEDKKADNMDCCKNVPKNRGKSR